MHNPTSQARQARRSGKSYCPIALLSPVAKLVEKLLLPCLQEHLPLANHQHGFHSGCNTITTLNYVTHKICTRLNCLKPCERTVLVALDLTSAFDTVSHEVLLGDIYNTNAPKYIKKWLATYINGRSTYVEFRGEDIQEKEGAAGSTSGGCAVSGPLQLLHELAASPAEQCHSHQLCR